MIPLCEPEIRGNEWAYIKDCLDTGWVSSVGAYVTRLEQTVAGLVGQNWGVATTSGTAALHLGLQLAGVQRDDLVLVSDLTFVAPVNCVRYLGAQPVLVDCDPKSLQMDVELVSRFLEEHCEPRDQGCWHRHSGRRVAAIVPVHVLGHPVDMDPLMEICGRFALPVVEDATESLGALYKGGPVGRHGLFSCYSFNGNKIVTAGGGGVLATADQGLADKARYLSTQAKDDSMYYVHNEIGYNYRLTNIQAALAVAQLEQLEDFVRAKRAIASRYQECFQAYADRLKLPYDQSWATSSCWLYTITLQGPAGARRDELLQYLNQHGVQARPLWNPIHKNAPFADCLYVTSGAAHSLDLVQRSVSLPSSVGLSEEQQAKVCQLVGQFLKM